MPTNVKPSVSVIIGSHRIGSIERCVAAFDPAIWESIRVEILVVADYPIDSLAGTYPDIIWIFHPDISIPSKRNAGVMRAQADIIGFIDDDCIPCDKWISTAVGYLQDNPLIAGVEGRTIIDVPENPGASLSQFKRLEKQGYRTNNIFYRRKAFIDAGMFDMRFTVQREDLDLAFTILERGMSISYNENQMVLHAFRHGERWDLLKNCINRRFDPLLYRKHKSLYRKHLRSPFPPGILLLMACHAAAAAAGIYSLRTGAGAFLFDTIIIFLMTERRVRGARIDIIQWAREFTAYAVSPLVLLGALIYGNVKFRSFLIV